MAFDFIARAAAKGAQSAVSPMIWRQRPSLVAGRSQGTPAANAARLQAQIDALAAVGGGTLRLVEDVIQIDSTLRLPRGVSVVGPGKNRCLIQNVRTATASTYGDSLFMAGNFNPASTTNLFGHPLSRAINAVTSGDGGVTLTIAGNASGFAAGDSVVVFDSARFYLDGGGNKISWYMAVRRVVSVSGAVVYLDEPLRDTVATGAIYNLRTGTIPGRDPNGTGSATPLFVWGDAEIGGFSAETRRYLVADGCAYKGLFADIEMRTARSLWYAETCQHSVWDGVGGRFWTSGGELMLNSEMTEVRNFRASFDAAAALANGGAFTTAISCQENGMDVTYRNGSIDVTGASGGNVVEVLNFLRARLNNVELRHAGATFTGTPLALGNGAAAAAGRRDTTDGRFDIRWSGPCARYLWIQSAATVGNVVTGDFRGTPTNEAFLINGPTARNAIAPTARFEQGQGKFGTGTTNQEVVGCYVGGGMAALTGTDFSTRANTVRDIRTASSVTRTLDDPIKSTGLVYPENFVPTAGTGGDDTAAITAAHNHAVANDLTVGLIPGKTYIFNGPGLTGTSFRIASAVSATRAAAEGTARIVLGAGVYLYDDSVYCPSVLIEGLATSGGAGIYRNTRTAATNATSMPTVRGCYFDGFTRAAISHDSADWPYWKIAENWFNAASAVDTCCVALSGLTDNCIIENNAFATCQIGIKLLGGNNAAIHRNDFITGNASHASAVVCVTIFLVPTPTITNSGQGLTIAFNKFGNERHTGNVDYRVLVANDTGAGSFGERMPDLLTSAANRFFSQVMIEYNLFNSYDDGTGVCNALVRSLTPQMNIFIRNNSIAGCAPRFVLESAFPPVYSTNANYCWDVGANTLEGTLTKFGSSECNYSEALRPQGGLYGLTGAQTTKAGAANYKVISRFLTRTGSGTTTRTFTTDQFGGSDAVTVTLGATGGLVLTGAGEGAGVVIGSKLFLEFDYQLAGVAGQIGCYLNINGVRVWNGVLAASSTVWRHACVEIPIIANGAADVVLNFIVNSAASVGTQCTIARPILYEAVAPANVLPYRGKQEVAMTNGGTTNGAAEYLLNTTAGTIAAHTVVLPTSPKDGDIFRLATYGAITALTVTGTTTSSPTTLAAGGAVAWAFSGGAARWFRV
jgi:hypothetical protein